MAKRAASRPSASAEPWSLAIVFRPLDDLVPDPKNARTHSPAQLELLAGLLTEIGWAVPIGEADGVLIYGHARRQAAMMLRDRGVHIAGTPDPDVAPVVDLAHLSDTQRTALALADNRIAELAGWDVEKLGEQLNELAAADFDISAIGFSAEDLGAPSVDAAAVVAEIPVGEVRDRFWISVRGPLQQQAAALQALRQVMSEIPDLTVELGTVSADE